MQQEPINHDRAEAPTQDTAWRAAGRWLARVHAIGPVVGLVLLCVAGTLLNRDFATFDTP